MHLIESCKGFLKWLWPTLYLSGVLKILHNLVFMQKYLFAVICSEVSKATESVQCDLTLIFTNLSETANSFVNIRAALEIKNVGSFYKNRFLLKTSLHNNA